jgi:uncharacterized protein YndB with AHSA1/START domain
MARIEVSTDIAAPRAEVFRLSHDLNRRPDWDERVIGVELITPPPLRRTSLIRIDVGRSGKFKFTWEGEYVSYQMPSSSTVSVIDAAPSSPFKKGTEHWDFSQTADGTHMTIVWEYEPRGFLSRISDTLGGRSATRNAIRRSLHNLKTLLETG